MIDGLIRGTLHDKPLQRNSKNGNPFVTAKVRVTTAQGESLFSNVIAFNDAPRRMLLALEANDTVAIAGTLTPKVWIDGNGEARPSLDVVAHAVLTAYQVKRKREAAAPAASHPARGRRGGGEDFSPFPDDGE